MPTVPIIGKSDRDDLGEMLRWWRSQSQNRRIPPGGQGSAAPEVYIARTPTTGIPALESSVGTGTGDASGDAPGQAECFIYEITEDSSPFTGTGTDNTSGVGMQLVSGLTQTVYNLARVAISGNQWVVVARDKFGRWVVTGPNAGGGSGVSGGFIGPVHVVDGSATGSGDWYCQLVHLVGSQWVVSDGPTNYATVYEINGLTPRKLDSSGSVGATALAVTNLFADENGEYYIDYPFLASSDTILIPATWSAICNADGTFTMTPATYQTITISWDNWSGFPRVKIEAT